MGKRVGMISLGCAKNQVNAEQMLYRLQQVSSRRLLSNIVYEFQRALPREEAQEAGYGLAALIDGLWLRAALSGKPLDKARAETLAEHFISKYLPPTSH